MAPSSDSSAPRLVGYQRPATLQRVLREFIVVDSLGAASIATKILLGLSLTLIGPFFVTVIAKAIEHNFRADFLPSFGWTFLIACAVFIPLLMRLERRTGGEFFSESVRGEGSTLTASSYGEYEMIGTKMAWLGYTELALTGPRLLWEAIDALRGRSRLDPAARALAAEIVADLFDAGEGVAVRTLFGPGRNARDVGRAIDYLVKREWIGIALKRDRIWLATPARERILRA